MNVSAWFACRVIGQHRTTQRHRPRSQTPTDPDAAPREWLRQWAHDHPRWGFRRAYHAARAEGWYVNHKRLQRLWREEGLRVPQHQVPRVLEIGRQVMDATDDVAHECPSTAAWCSLVKIA